MLNAMKCCIDAQTCCPSDANTKVLNVEFLYLDLNVCERCQKSDLQVEAALELLKPVLLELGITLKLHKINVNSETLAMQTHFLSSPTIRINGKDVSLEVEEDNCQSCGDLCGNSVDCRVFRYLGKTYHEPPKAMLVDAILKSIYNPERSSNQDSYQLPANLKKFYDGQKTIKR